MQTVARRMIHGVAIDAGSGLEASIRHARGNKSTTDDLVIFKKAVITSLGPFASTILVDAANGPQLLPHYPDACERMLAYEADVYHINDDERITALPENIKIADFADMGVRQLKFFMYYSPGDDAQLNQRKQDIVQNIGEHCLQCGLQFLMEPLVYDRNCAAGTEAYAKIKPGLVTQATELFAQQKFHASVLKVEVPVDLAFVEGFGQPLFSRDQALEAFRSAASAAGDKELVYLSAGVPFDWFEASLCMAVEAGVNYTGFMCGRAIWSDAVEVFGAQGEAGLRDWLADAGRQRLQRLIAALVPHN